jgi:hypothetical protein
MKRGQAAMEFIMTYGWAILVVLVMIGALAYFGVLNPKNYLPEKCVAAPGFNCKDYQVQDNSGGNMKFSLALENKLGSSVDIKSVNVTYAKGATVYSDTCGGVTPTLQADGQVTLACTFGGATSPGVGQPVTVNAVVKYQDTVNGIFPHTANFQIQTKVQP